MRETTAKKENITNKKPLLKGEAVYIKKSLNEAARKNDLVRIAKENRQMKERTRGKHVQSFYSRDELAKAEKERSKYVRNISKSHQRNTRLDRASSGNKQSAGEQGPLNNFLNEKKKEFNLLITITQKDGRPLILKTARQVRQDVALQCGRPLPVFQHLSITKQKTKHSCLAKASRKTETSICQDLFVPGEMMEHEQSTASHRIEEECVNNHGSHLSVVQSPTIYNSTTTNNIPKSTQDDDTIPEIR
eukprot:CAMPEP_0194362464 /NCGR_PEP_ID=MMETSP0174-20130528/10209_1 /TAXON_ID=216777 /ORGANISM="Proboscia alata, Strain PI-D3" /LENGTH=246 /DNA_ID=CAMNT_0039135345 /DNA_START=331 /DNA_END=1071 /DNA_ORIENTATION=-